MFLYIKSCYNDLGLNEYKEAFERPENLFIEIDCANYQSKRDNRKDDDSFSLNILLSLKDKFCAIFNFYKC